MCDSAPALQEETNAHNYFRRQDEEVKFRSIGRQRYEALARTEDRAYDKEDADEADSDEDFLSDDE